VPLVFEASSVFLVNGRARAKSLDYRFRGNDARDREAFVFVDVKHFRNVTVEGAQDVRRSLPAQERSQRTQPQRAKRCFLVTSLHQQRSYPLLAAEALSLRRKKGRWIPAFAGMTSKGKSARAKSLDSRLTSSAVVELFAGMTSG
jgi:hypothetical protein